MTDRVALRAGIPPFYVMDVWLAAAERQRTAISAELDRAAAEHPERYADFLEPDGSLTGPGLSAEEAHRISQSLQRLRPLAKNIVDAHGGEILLSSEPGKGTRVEIVLPRGAAGDGPA